MNIADRTVSFTDHRGCDPRDERCSNGCMDSDGTCCGGGFFCYLDETCRYSNDNSKVECCIFGSCTVANPVRLFSPRAPIATRTVSTSAPEDSLSTAVQAGQSEMDGTIRFPMTSTRVQQPESTIKSTEMFARDWESKHCGICVCDMDMDNHCPPGCC